MSDHQKRLEEARERIERQRAEREARGGLLGAFYAQAEAQEKAEAAGRAYRNRDKIPEPILHYADVYHWLTNQTPSPRTLKDWIQEFWYWDGEGLVGWDIWAAYLRLWNADILITRPGTLTNTAVAMMCEGGNQETIRTHLWEKFKDKNSKHFTIEEYGSVDALVDAKFAAYDLWLAFWLDEPEQQPIRHLFEWKEVESINMDEEGEA